MALKHVELNDRGQVTLPADVREYFGLVKDDELEVEIGSGGIVLLRTEPRRPRGSRRGSAHAAVRGRLLQYGVNHRQEG